MNLEFLTQVGRNPTLHAHAQLPRAFVCLQRYLNTLSCPSSRQKSPETTELEGLPVSQTPSLLQTLDPQVSLSQPLAATVLKKIKWEPPLKASCAAALYDEEYSSRISYPYTSGASARYVIVSYPTGRIREMPVIPPVGLLYVLSLKPNKRSKARTVTCPQALATFSCKQLYAHSCMEPFCKGRNCPSSLRNAPINCKPPPPPIGNHRGFDRFALPGGGELTTDKVGYGGGAH